MAAGQRITGDYTLEAASLINELTNINFKANNVSLVTVNPTPAPGENAFGTANVHANMHVYGNLRVDGVTTTVNSVQLTITDTIMTLGKDYVNGGNPLLHFKSGIEVDRGTGQFTPQLYWDEDLQAWILFDGVNNNYIVNNSTGGMGITKVEDDPAPKLGGNLDVNSKIVFSSTGEIAVQSPIVISKVTSAPPVPTEPESVVLYNNGAWGFDSGLSYINSGGLGGELISKQKALVFSLIF